MVNGLVFDSLHTLCLGVTKQLLELWITKYGIIRHLALINRRLLSWHPPSELGRLPRGLDLKSFKANEFRLDFINY